MAADLISLVLVARSLFAQDTLQADRHGNRPGHLALVSRSFTSIHPLVTKIFPET